MNSHLANISYELTLLEKWIDEYVHEEISALIRAPVKNYQRAEKLKEINLALKVLHLSTKMKSNQELFIYRTRSDGRYLFIPAPYIEVELKNGSESMSHLMENENLTLYSVFLERAEKLVKQISNGELDQYLSITPEEILSTIMEDGELAEVDDNTTDLRLAQLSANARFWRTRNIQ